MRLGPALLTGLIQSGFGFPPAEGARLDLYLLELRAASSDVLRDFDAVVLPLEEEGWHAAEAPPSPVEKPLVGLSFTLRF